MDTPEEFVLEEVVLEVHPMAEEASEEHPSTPTKITSNLP